MKQYYTLALVMAIAICSCKKEDSSASKTTVTTKDTVAKTTTNADTTKITGGPLVVTSPVLLAKIIDNIPNDPYFGAPEAEFTYSAKQLSKAVIYLYDPGYPQYNDTLTVTLNYTGAGVLTGDTFSHSYTSNGSGTEAIYTDNNGNIAIYDRSSGTAISPMGGADSLHYNNNVLGEWVSSYFNRTGTFRAQRNFKYDNNGNNTTRTITSVINGVAQPNNVLINNTFDTYHNITLALPYYNYFMVAQHEWLYFSPGANNPLSVNNNGTVFTYSYEYNSDGYPTKISWTDATAHSYLYEYIKAN